MYRSREEFAALLDIYNHYPICELTIHPRVMKQLYRGEADRAAFAAALPECRMPVCYNGDVTTPEALHALEAEFPQLSGIMVGRGLIADPALVPGRARGGAPASREELRGYCDDLYHGYTEAFGAASCARQPDEGALVLSHPIGSKGPTRWKSLSARPARGGSMRRW